MVQVGFEPRPCWSQACCFNHSTKLPSLQIQKYVNDVLYYKNIVWKYSVFHCILLLIVTAVTLLFDFIFIGYCIVYLIFGSCLPFTVANLAGLGDFPKFQSLGSKHSK